MQKVFSTNIAGQIFHINEDAFDQLSDYLASLKALYGNEEDGQEIMQDIEARIAEIIRSESKQAEPFIVHKELVSTIIQTVGSPAEHQKESNSRGNPSPQAETSGRVLYRDTENKVIAGVCAGLSQYFNIKDFIWVRLIFIFSVIAGIGSGLLIYLILWVLVPKKETTRIQKKTLIL